MMNKIKNMSMAMRIFIGMLLGIVAGLIFGEAMGNLQFIGTIWMNALRIPIAPIVFVMMVLGIGKQKNTKDLAGMSLALIAYYIMTTMVAACVALGLTTLMQPGVGFKIIGESTDINSAEITVSSFLQSLVPGNFLKPLVDNTILQVLCIGIMGGIGILILPDQEMKEKLITGFECLQTFFNQMLRLVLEVAPIGIFCFMGATVGCTGKTAFVSMGKFVTTMLAADGIQIIFYGVIVLLLGHKNPLKFYRNMFPSWAVSMTTASSVLCIPTNIEVVEGKYDVDPGFASFGIPLGSQLNTDGTAIFLPCVIVFAAQALGIQYDFGTLIYMALMATLISSSGGGTFGNGLVKLVMMCQMFAVPDSVVTMVSGMFAVIDLFITTVNITGDAAGVITIDAMGKRMNKNKAA